jgi:hypothetical protein
MEINSQFLWVISKCCRTLFIQGFLLGEKNGGAKLRLEQRLVLRVSWYFKLKFCMWISWVEWFRRQHMLLLLVGESGKLVMGEAKFEWGWAPHRPRISCTNLPLHFQHCNKSFWFMWSAVCYLMTPFVYRHSPDVCSKTPFLILLPIYVNRSF